MWFLTIIESIKDQFDKNWLVIALLMLLFWHFWNRHVKIDNRHVKFDEVIKDIRRAVERLEKNIFPDDPFLMPGSPLQLTESGQDYAERLKANDVAKRLADKVKIKKDANAYEIQQACMDFAKRDLLALLNDEEESLIEHVAYNSGQDVESFMGIFGLLLREIWLERRGITTGEIDTHDPSQTAEKPA